MLNFNFDSLAAIHTLNEFDFYNYLKSSFPQIEYLSPRPGRQLLYINNNSPVLGIAHLDGTMPATHFAIGQHKARPGHTCIFSPFVDDRLGVYTLLYLLPSIGINVDVLLSEGEEVGDPTSQWFVPRKKYNWMFQFDRKGTDAVHYQYTEQSWLNALAKYFKDINHGIFSDISYMEHLNIQGVNIGTGYYDYTSLAGWASLDDLSNQVRRFEGFYNKYKKVKFVTPRFMRGKRW